MCVDFMVIFVQNVKSGFDPFVVLRQFGEIIRVLDRVMFVQALNKYPAIARQA